MSKLKRCGKGKADFLFLMMLTLALFTLPALRGGAQQRPTENPFINHLGSAPTAASDPAFTARYNSKLKEAALLFTENRGQVADAKGARLSEVLFTARGGGAAVFLTATGIHYQFARTIFPEGYVHDPREVKDPELQAALRKKLKRETHRFTLELAGANPTPRIRKEEKSDYMENFYLAQCGDGITGVHTYKRVVLEEVYPGIDWVVYSNSQGIKYDFVVRPGADPSAIRLKVSDAESVSISEGGELVMETTLGTVTEERPVSFSGSQKLQTSFSRRNDGTIGFNVIGWNKTQTLTIDPVVSWATYYGSPDAEYGRACAVDASGDVYLVGQIGALMGSTTLSTPGSHQTVHGGDFYDAFVVKFSATGVRQWATYYGGGGDDVPYFCAASGTDLYFTGETTNSFATSIATTGSHQPNPGGGIDAFLVKLNSAGVRQWGTYYGGSGSEFGYSCAIAGTDVYLAGYTSTSSGTAIATPGSHQPSYGGSFFDAFLVKFDAAGVRQWGTYYGGAGVDFGNSVAAVGSDVYLAGRSILSGGTSIATAGSHQSTPDAGTDAYLAKFNSAGVRQWGTYYGGGGDEYGNACVVAGTDVYLAGYTSTSGGTAIATPGSHQPTYSGGEDAFLAKFNASGARQWGTYYGGTGVDYGFSCAAAGTDVYLAGGTSSSGGTAIATPGSPQAVLGGNTDAFLVKFSDAGARQWGTYYGGAANDLGNWCVTSGTDVYLAGQTVSATSIATSGSHQATYGGGLSDAFLVKMVETVAAPEINITGNGASIPDGSATPSTANHTDFGPGGTSRTFTIENTGTAVLSISGITLTGANAGDFSISGAPTSLAANSTATFTVNFASAVGGQRTATVNIASNDADEAVYDFAIAANICPDLLLQPTNTATCAGVAATFSVQTSGAVTYQWRRGGTNIPGAVSASYTLANPTPADSNATFDVVITPSPAIAGCSSVTSAPATLFVNRHTWTGTTSAAWTNPANWNGCGVPTATSYVYIPGPNPGMLFMPEISTAVSVWQLTSAGAVTVLPTGSLDVLGF